MGKDVNDRCDIRLWNCRGILGPSIAGLRTRKKPGAGFGMLRLFGVPVTLSPQNAWQKCLDFQVPSGDEISDEVLMPRNTEATWVVIAEVHFMYRLRFLPIHVFRASLWGILSGHLQVAARTPGPLALRLCPGANPVDAFLSAGDAEPGGVCVRTANSTARLVPGRPDALVITWSPELGLCSMSEAPCAMKLHVLRWERAPPTDSKRTGTPHGGRPEVCTASRSCDVAT